MSWKKDSYVGHSCEFLNFYAIKLRTTGLGNFCLSNFSPITFLQMGLELLCWFFLYQAASNKTEMIQRVLKMETGQASGIKIYHRGKS